MAKLKKIPVKVSPNPVKETIFLNAAGQRIDNPKTKRVIGNAFEVDPPAPEGEVSEETPTQQGGNPLATIIEKKVQEAVAKSISKIDIGKMVEKAIGDAFGVDE